MFHKICYFLPGPTDPAYRKRRVVKVWIRGRKGGKRALLAIIRQHQITMKASNVAVCTCGWSGSSGDAMTTLRIAYQHLEDNGGGQWHGDL